MLQSGYTALLCASVRGHLSVVKVLMDRGADIILKNDVRQRVGGQGHVCDEGLSLPLYLCIRESLILSWAKHDKRA